MALQNLPWVNLTSSERLFMSHQKLFMCVTCLLLVFCASARSQESARGADDTAAAALRGKAIDLLESVAAQVESLRSAENRARIRSNIAELLWKHDEKRARSLFAVVGEDINAGFNNEDSDEGTRNHTLLVFWQLRSDTLSRIAKHDPELTLAFFQSTRPPANIELPYQMRDGQKSLELRLASEIAAKNPQIALKLGRESLANGFSPELVSVLIKLKRTDQSAAQVFHKEIVDKLKNVDLAEDYTAIAVSVNLARSFQPPEANDSVYRDLLGVLLASALENGCADTTAEYPPQICVEVGTLFSRIEKYHGTRAAPLKRWAQSEEGTSPETWEEVREVLQEGTVDEILALAEKYPEMQRQAYWEALGKAQAAGDTDKARKIASEFPDEEGRSYMLAQIEGNQEWKSLNAEKLTQVQQELSALRTNEERIQFLLMVAMQLGRNDRKAALGLLSQAGQIIDSTRPGRAQLEGQIALAMLYCSLKSDRGFSIMESLIPRFNELVAASTLLDGFGHTYIRDGEWNMSGEGDVGRLLNTVAQNAGFFAALDFDRSVNLASQMERPELRLMAKLKIAQGVLAGTANPALMFQVYRHH